MSIASIAKTVGHPSSVATEWSDQSLSMMFGEFFIIEMAAIEEPRTILEALNYRSTFFFRQVATR